MSTTFHLVPQRYIPVSIAIVALFVLAALDIIPIWALIVSLLSPYIAIVVIALCLQFLVITGNITIVRTDDAEDSE